MRKSGVNLGNSFTNNQKYTYKRWVSLFDLDTWLTIDEIQDQVGDFYYNMGVYEKEKN